jgi:CBS domain-containing protein
MKVSDLLTPDRIAVPLVGDGLEDALLRLLGRLEGGASLREGSAAMVAAALAAGAAGDLVRVHEDIVLLAVRTDKVSDLTVALGVSPSPIPLAPRLPGESTRALLLLLTPRRLSTLKVQALPSLLRIFRDTERAARLVASRDPGDVLALRELMELELHERLLVEDVMTPVTYRIFPDTPLREVLDLMVRRDLAAVPVVGERYEVLGVITAAEALRHLLPRRVSGEGESAAVALGSTSAREVMSRSVMCVAEDQSLLEAANLMVNRDMAQVPVIRDGEFVGFLTRDAVLRRLAES